MGQIPGRGWYWESQHFAAQPDACLGCPLPGQSPASAANLDIGFGPSPPVPGPSHARFLAHWQLPAGRGLSGWRCRVPPLLPSPSSCPGASESAWPCHLPQFSPHFSCQPWGALGSPTLGGHPQDCCLRGCALSWHLHPWDSTHHPPKGLPGPWGWILSLAGGSLAALPGVMLPLSAGIHPLARLVPINRWWHL